MCLVKFSDQQAIWKTDWLSTLIGDTFAYLACVHSKDPQIQISLATIVIAKNRDEPEISNANATTHQNYRIYTDTRLSTSKTTGSINTRIHPDPRRTHQPFFVFKKQISRKVLHRWGW
jgi:hypothetical protein